MHHGEALLLCVVIMKCVVRNSYNWVSIYNLYECGKLHDRLFIFSQT
jgi:hypothetical protein